MLNYIKGMNNTPYNEDAYQNYLDGDYNPDQAAANIALAIETLIGKGGETFLVPNLIINGGDAPEWKAAFDAALLTQLSLLNTEYADDGIDFYLLDWNKVNLEGIAYNNIMMPDGIHPTTAHHERIAAIAWTQIPVPATMLLLGLGLLGLVGVRRKIKK